MVRNMSGGSSAKAQIILRNYVMERFFERSSFSRYRDNLILKGGILIASMIGIDKHLTMDMDATLKNIPLTPKSVEKIIGEILSVVIEDRMTFKILSTTTILDEADYTGVLLIFKLNEENFAC